MISFFPYIIGVIDTLNDWNEKLKNITMSGNNNVALATAIIAIIFVVTAWAVRKFK